MTTQIRFCNSFDGVRLAYSQAGRGPAMLEVATWLNHLEHDWKSPVWGPRLTELTAHYTLTRYDGRGCGLSERNVKDLTFDACLCDLEAVVDAAGTQAVHPARVLPGNWFGDRIRGTPPGSGQPPDPLRSVCARKNEAQAIAPRHRRDQHHAETRRARLGPRSFGIPSSLYGAVHPGEQTGTISLVFRPTTNVDFGCLGPLAQVSAEFKKIWSAPGPGAT